MNANWYDAGWFWALIGWVIGIPSGVFVNWLYDRLKMRSKSKGEYFTYNISNNYIIFEGRASTTASIQDIVQQTIGQKIKPPRTSKYLPYR